MNEEKIIVPAYEPSKKIDPKTGEELDVLNEKHANRLARIIRPASVIIFSLYFIFSAIGGAVTGNYFAIITAFIETVIYIVLGFAIAQILDYLAEITAILKGGYEVKKK